MLIKKLMDPKVHRRLGSGHEGGKAVLREAFFTGIDTFKVLFKEYTAKHIPRSKDPYDTQNFHVKKGREAFSIATLIEGHGT